MIFFLVTVFFNIHVASSVIVVATPLMTVTSSQSVSSIALKWPTYQLQELNQESHQSNGLLLLKSLNNIFHCH